MSLEVPNASFPATSNYSQEIDDIVHKEDEDDVCISIEGFPGSDQSGFYKAESLQSSTHKEKQILVDPISVKHSMRYEGPPLLLPPIDTSFTDFPLNPPPLPPSKHKFLSASLPGSTTASPRTARLPHMKNGKKWRNQVQPCPLPTNHLSRQHTFGFSRFGPESHLLRSKSCGEGRASSPSDEFELFSRKLSISPRQVSRKVLCSSPRHGDDHEEDDQGYSSGYKSRDYLSGKKKAIKEYKPNHKEFAKFKCGALCLFLPAFGKGKPVRARKVGKPVVVVERNVISRTVSLEKFECGSWSSSAIINDDDEDSKSMYTSSNLYFDLPLELIQNCGGNDANFPVKTAFVFDRDRKGVLKKSSSSRTAGSRKSHESSSRFVQISTSGGGSPAYSCITPRLRKARDDFNAFLQAQNA